MTFLQLYYTILVEVQYIDSYSSLLVLVKLNAYELEYQYSVKGGKKNPHLEAQDTLFIHQNRLIIKAI